MSFSGLAVDGPGDLQPKFRIIFPQFLELGFVQLHLGLKRDKARVPIGHDFLQGQKIGLEGGLAGRNNPEPVRQGRSGAAFLVRADNVEDGFLDKDALIGRMLKRNMAKGQLLLAQDIENSLQVLKLKQNLRANELISSTAYERVAVGKEAVPAGVWLGAELPPGARLNRDMQVGQILLSTDVAESRQVVFANTNMVAGQALKAGSLRLEKLDQDKLSRTHLFELAGLEGFEVTRTIRAGEALRTTDLRPALLVKRGEMVVLSIGRPSEFEITIKLEAMQDGRMGEQVKLKNAETGRILNGIVTGLGQLRGS